MGCRVTPCLNLQVDVVDYEEDNERGVDVHFTHEAVAPWILDLSLVAYELVDFACISDANASFRLRVGLDHTQVPRGSVVWEPGGAILRVRTQELEAWISFFLEYYRDGMGPVDHIDVGVPPRYSNGETGLFLTLTVPLARASRSEAELRRALGLP